MVLRSVTYLRRGVLVGVDTVESFLGGVEHKFGRIVATDIINTVC